MRVGSRSAAPASCHPRKARDRTSAGLTPARYAAQARSRWNGRRTTQGQAAHRLPQCRRWAATGHARRRRLKTRQVVVAALVDAGHFGCFAPDQRAAGQKAALPNSADDRRALVRVQLARREIVEEEERFSALHHKIVCAHCDKVDADGVVDTGLDGNLEFRADAVIGRDEHRIVETGSLEVEQAAEAADLAIRARPPRRTDQRLDLLDHGVSSVDVHACLRIGESIFPVAHFAPLPRRLSAALRMKRPAPQQNAAFPVPAEGKNATWLPPTPRTLRVGVVSTMYRTWSWSMMKGLVCRRELAC